jgi:simple sugar transport system substrate-binding protein
MLKDLENGSAPAQKIVISEEKGFDATEITQADVDKYGLGE